MTTSDMRSLASELGDTVPEGIETLTDEELTGVADRLHEPTCGRSSTRRSPPLARAHRQALPEGVAR